MPIRRLDLAEHTKNVLCNYFVRKSNANTKTNHHLAKDFHYFQLSSKMLTSSHVEIPRLIRANAHMPETLSDIGDQFYAD